VRIKQIILYHIPLNNLDTAMTPKNTRMPLQRALSDSSAVTKGSLRSSSIFNVEHATAVDSVKTVHCLEDELVKLRDSTKDALQQAWEEVEVLQQQCASHLDITTQLEADFMETKKKENYWHKRCLEAEMKSMQNNTSESSLLSTKSVLTVEGGSYTGWPSAKGFARGIQRQASIDTLDHFGKKNTRPALGDRSMSVQGTSTNNLICDDDDDYVVNLKTKVTSRESAVRSLERTVAQHVKAMHTMQAEMQCMMEAQRIKEKNAQANYLRKEDIIVKEITSLHQDLDTKLKIIASQKKRIKEYKVYIKELTNELERSLQILQVAEPEISPVKIRQKKQVEKGKLGA